MHSSRSHPDAAAKRYLDFARDKARANANVDPDLCTLNAVSIAPTIALASTRIETLTTTGGVRLVIKERERGARHYPRIIAIITRVILYGDATRDTAMSSTVSIRRSVRACARVALLIHGRVRATRHVCEYQEPDHYGTLSNVFPIDAITERDNGLLVSWNSNLAVRDSSREYETRDSFSAQRAEEFVDRSG